MRKRLVIAPIFFIFLISLALVSAADPVSGVGDLLEEGKRLVVIIINFATDILFNVNQIEDFLFAKILVSLLIFMIVYTVLKKNNFLTSDKKIHLIIALAVTFLAVRFIPDSDFMNAILLPYGVMGVALTVFLPFMIYFFFVYQSSIGYFGRRAAWILFGIVFMVLWAMRKADISEIGGYIYLGGILFVLISLVFDKSIHRWFGYAGFKRARDRLEHKSKVTNYEEWERYRDHYEKTGDLKSKREMERLAKTFGRG